MIEMLEQFFVTSHDSSKRPGYLPTRQYLITAHQIRFMRLPRDGSDTASHISLVSALPCPHNAIKLPLLAFEVAHRCTEVSNPDSPHIGFDAVAAAEIVIAIYTQISAVPVNDVFDSMLPPKHLRPS